MADVNSCVFASIFRMPLLILTHALFFSYFNLSWSIGNITVWNILRNLNTPFLSWEQYKTRTFSTNTTQHSYILSSSLKIVSRSGVINLKLSYHSHEEVFMTARVRPDQNSFYNYQLLRLTLRQVMRLTANSEPPWPVNVVFPAFINLLVSPGHLRTFFFFAFLIQTFYVCCYFFSNHLIFCQMQTD